MMDFFVIVFILSPIYSLLATLDNFVKNKTQKIFLLALRSAIFVLFFDIIYGQLGKLSLISMAVALILFVAISYVNRHSKDQFGRGLSWWGWYFLILIDFLISWGSVYLFTFSKSGILVP